MFAYNNTYTNTYLYIHFIVISITFYQLLLIIIKKQLPVTLALSDI